jgi:hypothetical protein
VLAEAVAEDAADTATGDDAANDLIGRLYRALPQDLRHLARHRDHA